jgi:hypothetical protein
VSIFSDRSAADRAKAKRAAAPVNHSGKHLSWGGSGRAETKPGLFGLGSRVVKDIEQENSKSGYYGVFGAKHVASKGREAQRRAQAKRGGKNGSWWS